MDGFGNAISYSYVTNPCFYFNAADIYNNFFGIDKENKITIYYIISSVLFVLD